MKTVKIGNITLGEGCPKICVPVVGRTAGQIEQEAVYIREMACQPDMVEIRGDWYEEVLNTDALLKLLKKVRELLSGMPLLFTFRTAKEGGEREISMESYQKLLLAVSRSGLVDAVDVEIFSFGESMEALVKQLQQEGMKVIGSNHDFKKTPQEEELTRRLYAMKDIGVDVAKLAVMPEEEQDVIRLLWATLKAGTDDKMCPVITMSMAGKGVISRISGEIFHSAVTFASAGKASAPGQIPIEELRQILDVIHRGL